MRKSSTPVGSPTKRINPDLVAPKKIMLLERAASTHAVLTNQIAEQIQAFLPLLQQLTDEWRLVYSLDQHGISISTLFEKSALLQGSSVLLLKDLNGGIFGAYMSEMPAWKKGYYGNGTSFLFKLNGSHGLAAYLTSSINEHYILSEHGANLAFGGGEGFALWIDHNLERGYSSSCSTYGNDPLSSQGKDFDIVGLELWQI